MLEESEDLRTWSRRETVGLLVPLQAGETTKFFRYAMQADASFPVPADADLFAWVPAGSFTMGDGLDDLADAPEHTVSVSGFFIGKHEVSWSQWQEVRDWAVANGYSDLVGVGSGKGDEHPVHSVNWYDAVKWCNAASERAGLDPVYTLTHGGAVYRTGETTPYIDTRKQGYRLPTEAEWEKAARGGLSGKRFPWGDVIRQSDANYLASSSFTYDSSSGDSIPTTTMAVHRTPAPWAVCGEWLRPADMAGNVWEGARTGGPVVL